MLVNTLMKTFIKISYLNLWHFCNLRLGQFNFTPFYYNYSNFNQGIEQKPLDFVFISHCSSLVVHYWRHSGYKTGGFGTIVSFNESCGTRTFIKTKVETLTQKWLDSIKTIEAILGLYFL